MKRIVENQGMIRTGFSLRSLLLEKKEPVHLSLYPPCWHQGYFDELFRLPPLLVVP
jgi:hypothetical protein